MFTNNFIKIQKAIFMSVDASLIRSNGNTYRIGSANSYTYRFVGLGFWLNKGRCMEISTTYCRQADLPNKINTDGIGGVWFGTSPTPPTKDDYTLGSAITSGLTVTSPSAITQKDEGDGKHTFLSDYIVRNDTDADISIYELGLFAAPADANAYAYNVLMERTVLTEPITIPAGESRLVTYKLTFNQTLSVD